LQAILRLQLFSLRDFSRRPERQRVFQLLTTRSPAMPISETYRPARAFEALGDTYSDAVEAASFPSHGRFEALPDGMPKPRAIRYHGHQFRHYNPDLGDGRGFLFAQLHGKDGRLLDLSTKGSGQTPYSRSGDGRLTLKGGVREILASAMLEARGVNTSKGFSLIETGEALERHDEPSPTRSAVLTRLSHSHLRFGVFQRHAFHDDRDALKTLIDHAAEHYLPEIMEADDKPAALLAAACRNTARMTAQWMAAGFVHGVLNTDNVTITGESFDYGPFRFLPQFEPGFTAAYFDHSGLYAFARQPEAVFWNCQALASAISALGSPDDALVAALREFEPAYRLGLRDAMFARLGLTITDVLEEDLSFVRDTLAHLEDSKTPRARRPAV